MMQIPLNVIVVKALSSGELSGYELMKKVNDETVYWKPSPGTMYPLLEKLEKRGLVTSRTDGKKRLYKLTAKAKVFMKITSTKKASMAKYSVCCLKTYKFLFGDDVVVPMTKEDDASAPYLDDIMALRAEIMKKSNISDPDKIKRIRSIVKSACSEIRKI